MNAGVGRVVTKMIACMVSRSPYGER